MVVEKDGEQFEVVDVHTHLGKSTLLQSFLGMSEFTAEDMIRSMDEVGEDKVVSFPTGPHLDYTEENKMVAEAMKNHPDRIIGFARINVNRGPERTYKDMDKFIGKFGLQGVKLHPMTDYFPLHRAARYLVDPVFERAEKYGIPILFHSGESAAAKPACIADIAADYPHVKVIMAHVGVMEYWEEAIVGARNVDNVYLGTSEMGWVIPIVLAVKELGPEKVVYGSDHPYNPMGLELGKVLNYCRLTKEELRLILGENLKRILGID